MARPWRTAGYGDPLALLATQAKIGVRRVEPPADGTASLRADAAANLARYRDTKDASALVSALRDLERSGDDEAVRKAWDIAVTTDRAADAAPFALGALYRARDIERYPVAFAKCADKSRLAREMLWQLFVPRLTTLDDKRIVALLGRYPRGRDPSGAQGDLATIKPAAIRVLGRDGWNALCDAALRELAGNKAAQDRIQSLR